MTDRYSSTAQTTNGIVKVISSPPSGQTRTSGGSNYPLDSRIKPSSLIRPQ